MRCDADINLGGAYERAEGKTGCGAGSDWSDIKVLGALVDVELVFRSHSDIRRSVILCP